MSTADRQKADILNDPSNLPKLPHMLDMRVIFMDVAVGRWGLPSVEMETLLWRTPNPV